MNGLTVKIYTRSSLLEIQYDGLNLYGVSTERRGSLEVSHNDLLNISQVVTDASHVAERMNASGNRVPFSMPIGDIAEAHMWPTSRKKTNWALTLKFTGTNKPYTQIEDLHPQSLATAINAITAEVQRWCDEHAN